MLSTKCNYINNVIHPKEKNTIPFVDYSSKIAIFDKNTYTSLLCNLVFVIWSSSTLSTLEKFYPSCLLLFGKIYSTCLFHPTRLLISRKKSSLHAYSSYTFIR